MLFPQPWPDGGKIKRKAGSRRIGCSSKWTETPPLWSAGKSPEGCLRRDLLGGWGGAVPCVMGRHHACPTWDLNRVLEVKKEKNWGAVLAGRFGRIVREGSVSASTGGGRLASGRGREGHRSRDTAVGGGGWKTVQNYAHYQRIFMLDNKMC